MTDRLGATFLSARLALRRAADKAVRSVQSLFVVAVLAAAIAAPATTASADVYVDRINAYLREFDASRHVDNTLREGLVGMDANPIATLNRHYYELLLIGPGRSGWDTAAAWANAEPQRKALEAMKQATANTSHRSHGVLGQPYGTIAVGFEFVADNFYTELGDPPLLARAQFFYLDHIRNGLDLLFVEARRLEEDGQIRAAADTALRSVHLARIVAERELFAEVEFGMMQMQVGLELLRDIVYTDSRQPRPRLTATDASELAAALNERNSFVAIDRIRFPRGQRQAGEQLVGTIYTGARRDPPNPDRFAAIMSLISEPARPLRRFSARANWQNVADEQTTAEIARRNVVNVFEGWANRWTFTFTDPILSEPSDFARMNKQQNAVAVAVAEGGERLFQIRRRLATELRGTRLAIALHAVSLTTGGSIPPSAASARPQFIDEIPDDPFATRPNVKFEFYVPSRVRRADADLLYRVSVYPRSPEIPSGDRLFPDFQVPFGANDYILYSVGVDGERNAAREATQAHPEYRAGDFVIWPPTVAMLRTYLKQTRQY